MLAAYASDAILFHAGGAVKGTSELRDAFIGMFAEWGKPAVTFELVNKIVEGDSAVIHWNARTADNTYQGGSDAFRLKNGKIVSHFFSAHITPN